MCWYLWYIITWAAPAMKWSQMKMGGKACIEFMVDIWVCPHLQVITPII
jgi:hypothetical protein